jgi:hypothetical protein
MNIDAIIKEAELAVKHAQEVRLFHRKRTQRGDAQRRTDLTIAYDRVREAMHPLRSESGRFAHQARTPATVKRHERIREASKALQRERRKLWKMMTPEERNQ